MMQFGKFLSCIFIKVTIIRECNFAMGTTSGNGFAQALMLTSQHECTVFTFVKPFPKIVPMAKLDILYVRYDLLSGF